MGDSTIPFLAYYLSFDSGISILGETFLVGPSAEGFTSKSKIFLQLWWQLKPIPRFS
jgi:hypothetical protein